MKKLLTIIFAICLVAAYTMPAMAIDDIDPAVAVGDNNTQATDNADQNIVTGQAQDAQYAAMNSTVDSNKNTTNDQDTLTVGDVGTDDVSGKNAANDQSVAFDEINALNGNGTDEVDGKNAANDNSVAFDEINAGNDKVEGKNAANDNSIAFDEIEVKDVANDKSDDDVIDNKDGKMDNDLVDNKDGNMDNDLIDQDNTDNDLVDNDSHDNDNDVVDVDQNKTDNDLADNDMNDNVAAAAMGGFALGIKIDDIELNLASTTNVSGITQISGFGAGAANLGFWNDDAEVKYEGNCNHIDASVYDNTGIQAANFTAGNFNNSANMNNVTMTVQW